jgi:hypothetical protein
MTMVNKQADPRLVRAYFTVPVDNHGPALDAIHDAMIAAGAEYVVGEAFRANHWCGHARLYPEARAAFRRQIAVVRPDVALLDAPTWDSRGWTPKEGRGDGDE